MEGETELLDCSRDLRTAAVVDHLILMPLTSFATAPVETPITASVYALSRHPMHLSRVLV